MQRLTLSHSYLNVIGVISAPLSFKYHRVYSVIRTRKIVGYLFSKNYFRYWRQTKPLTNILNLTRVNLQKSPTIRGLRVSRKVSLNLTVVKADYNGNKIDLIKNNNYKKKTKQNKRRRERKKGRKKKSKKAKRRHETVALGRRLLINGPFRGGL